MSNAFNGSLVGKHFKIIGTNDLDTVCTCVVPYWKENTFEQAQAVCKSNYRYSSPGIIWTDSRFTCMQNYATQYRAQYQYDLSLEKYRRDSQSISANISANCGPKYFKYLGFCRTVPCNHAIFFKELCTVYPTLRMDVT